MKLKVMISARHIHLTKETLEILFGEEFKLEPRNELTQPGQFASTSTVTIKTTAGQIENARILGPVRDYNQIEISKTDAYKLKITPPIRNSGDIKNTPLITLIGPKGKLEIEGVIIAVRHLHLHPQDIEKYKLKNQENIKVLIPGIKGGILNNIVIKTDESYKTEIHLDTDDANAHEIMCGSEYEIIGGDNNE